METRSTSDTLTVSTPSDTQILITRQFEASKHLVWRAYTEPDLIRRWWAGDRGRVDSIESDFRVGGTWRYVMTANGGFEVAFHGEFREIVPDTRIVTTEVYEDAPDFPALDTMELREDDGRTTLTILVQHGSQQARDMHLQSGMEGGLREALNHLDEVVAELAG
jgi:uncharacterized protein YndB with AHSA1/START domain